MLLNSHSYMLKPDSWLFIQYSQTRERREIKPKVKVGQLHPVENYSKHAQEEFCFSAARKGECRNTVSDFSPLDFCLCFFSL